MKRSFIVVLTAAVSILATSLVVYHMQYLKNRNYSSRESSALFRRIELRMLTDLAVVLLHNMEIKGEYPDGSNAILQLLRQESAGEFENLITSGRIVRPVYYVATDRRSCAVVLPTELRAVHLLSCDEVKRIAVNGYRQPASCFSYLHRPEHPFCSKRYFAEANMFVFLSQDGECFLNAWDGFLSEGKYGIKRYRLTAKGFEVPPMASVSGPASR